MKFNKLALLLGIVLSAALLCGCSNETSLPTSDSNPPPVDHNPAVKVVVTTDFGQVVLVEKAVDIEENTTALDALQQVAEVNTKYGGGFVDAINGISSEYKGANGKKKDWFFYINGMSSKLGANDYVLHDGDIEQWDFRDWSFRQFIPATIGNLPEPFIHGYGGVVYPTVVAYQDGWEEQAGQIAVKLTDFGVESICTKNANELSADEKESSNLILLGASNWQLMEELNQAWDRLGFYVRFEEGNLNVFDSKGDLAAIYGAGTGVIQVTQSPWNPKGVGACENIVCVVSGPDESGVKAAASALVNCYNDFKYAYALVVVGEELIRVPQ